MKRLWNGFWDMGKVQVPPLPPKLILTDRVTGERKQLSFNTETDVLTAIAVDNRKEAGIVYEAYNEPRFPEDWRYRLVLSNGVYQAELVSEPDYVTEHGNLSIYARSGNSSREVLLSEFL